MRRFAADLRVPLHKLAAGLSREPAVEDIALPRRFRQLAVGITEDDSHLILGEHAAAGVERHVDVDRQLFGAAVAYAVAVLIRMSLVLVDGMAAVRTGLAAPVLGLAVVLPVAVSKAVALIGRGAYVAGTGGAVVLHLVLRGAVGVVPRSGVVAAVGCRPAAASGTGGRAAVLAAVVVRPAAVAVAVARAAVNESAAVVAVFVPVAAVPLCVCGVMVTGLHIDIAADRADPIRVK